jgi:hypothetical protein
MLRLKNWFFPSLFALDFACARKFSVDNEASHYKAAGYRLEFVQWVDYRLKLCCQL